MFLKFTGQQLPSHIGLFNCRYPVFPFVPKARICFSCFRIGHLSKACKSSPRCLHCGDSAHTSSKDCPNSSLPAKCINCGGDHLATSHDCPEVTRHKMALSLAATRNIPYSEARRSVSPPSSSTSPFSSLPSDPRFDFLNFPSLPQPRSFPSPPPLLMNRFSPLSNLPQDPTSSNYSDNSHVHTHSHKSFSQAAQQQQQQQPKGRLAIPTSHSPSHSHLSPPPHSHSPPTPRFSYPNDHHSLLFEPNGRPPPSPFSHPLPAFNPYSPYPQSSPPPQFPASGGSLEDLLNLLSSHAIMIQQLLNSLGGSLPGANSYADFHPFHRQQHHTSQDQPSSSWFYGTSSQP